MYLSLMKSMIDTILRNEAESYAVPSGNGDLDLVYTNIRLVHFLAPLLSLKLGRETPAMPNRGNDAHEVQVNRHGMAASKTLLYRLAVRGGHFAVKQLGLL
jgi:hypothetical protein